MNGSGPIVERLVNLVASAGDAILEIYESPFTVTTKEDDSPLTQADLASHRVLLEGIAALTPEIPIVSEESAPPDYGVRRTWPRHWLVDPLDGTKEFVGRNGEFTVNVALIEAGRPILGVVGVPAQGRIFVGSVPDGRAECRSTRGVEVLHTRRLDRARGVVVVASRSHGGERLEAFIDALGASFSKVERTPMGSSLKLCVLAEGRADLYPRLGPTSEWDIAAAHAVLEAAGGAVWTFERGTLGYNRKDSFLNPDFLAVGDPSADWWNLLPPV
jgi:3'(2'), 5'-bisphosphate nucleotidase